MMSKLNTFKWSSSKHFKVRIRKRLRKNISRKKLVNVLWKGDSNRKERNLGFGAGDQWPRVWTDFRIRKSWRMQRYIRKFTRAHSEEISNFWEKNIRGVLTYNLCSRLNYFPCIECIVRNIRPACLQERGSYIYTEMLKVCTYVRSWKYVKDVT